MLKRHVELQQYAVRATDARIGHVGTFMVERGQWAIRYLTVNTGDRLDQRPVLLNRAAFERIDHNAKQLILNLSRDDVEKSPEVNPEEPITRENQKQLHDYYRWPAYWGRDEEDIIDTSQMAFEESADPADAQGDVLEDAEPTDLQSVSDLETFFHVDTTDEDIGRLCDVVIDTETWEVVYLVCELSDPQGTVVLIPAAYVERVEWADGHIYVDFDAPTVRNSPAFRTADSISDEQIALVEDYYGQQT